MATGPTLGVSAPPAAPPRVGLVAAAITNRENNRWENGFDFLPEACGTSGSLDPCDNETSKTIGDNPDVVHVDSFTVWAGFKCSALGMANREEALKSLVIRKLEAVTSEQVAREFWTGALQEDKDVPNRFLASPRSNVVNVDNTSQSLVNGLACLEAGLADCYSGGRGFIHATRQVVSLWHQGGALRKEGNLILTINDTIVVPDAGYDGSGPNGEAPAAGSVWAYATSPVDVRLTAPEVVGDMSTWVDRTDNTLEVRAERLAAVSFDGCCHIAVELDAPLCGIGGS